MRVSVIVPTFNRSRFLRECVNSILAQTFKDFELIVVDDGSDDDTPSVLAEYRGVKVISQGNRGVSAARNTGIAHARGEYIAFCDSDDLWQPEKLEVQMAFFQCDPKARVCYSDEIWVRQGRRVNPCKHHEKSSGWIFEKCLNLCIVSPSSVMMHRDFFETVGTFDEELPVCEDYDLWLRASLVFPFHFIPMSLIVKRGGHEDQLSRAFWGMDRFRVMAILKCLRQPLPPHQRKLAAEVLFQKCTILANGAVKRGHLKEASEYQNIIQKWALPYLDRENLTLKNRELHEAHIF